MFRSTLLCLLLTTGCRMDEDPASHQRDPPSTGPDLLEVDPRYTTDTLVQSLTPRVDVLFVIDNSCSMGQEQMLLADDFPVFIDFFLDSGLDYHIGVISTDTNDPSHSGKLIGAGGYRWIDEDTEQPSEVLGQMARIGFGGSNEKGRDAAYRALAILTQTESDPNYGFTREDATLHIIFVSDENDHSTEITLADWMEYLTTLKGFEDMVEVSSFVSPNPVCPTAAEPGDGYVVVTNAVGGLFWSICNENWDTALDLLGVQTVSFPSVYRRFYLTRLPVPGTIDVWVEQDDMSYGFEEELDWAYDVVTNSILFHEYIPSPFAEVNVKYRVLSVSEAFDP